MNKKNILLLEDDISITNIIKLTFKSEYNFFCFSTVHEASEFIDEHPIDGAILDINLPDGNGIHFCQTLTHSQQVPIIFLTSETDLSPKILAFNAGANDYLAKPFEPVELKLRLENILKYNTITIDTVNIGNLQIKSSLAKIFYINEDKNMDLNITMSEFRIFNSLMENLNEFVHRKTLIKALAGQGIYILERTIDQHIYTLRKKIAQSNCEIISKRSLGYSLKLKDITSKLSA